MTTKLKYVETPKSLFITHEGRQICIKRKDSLFRKVLDFLSNGDDKSALDLINPEERIKKYTDNLITVNDKGDVFLKGDKEPIHPVIAQKLLVFSREDLPFRALYNFVKNLKKNPSEWAREQLYTFLSKNHHPITEDGCFIAYKYVSKGEDGKLVDSYTGTFNNNIGSVPRMKRKDVNPDPNQTCSQGLHTAAFEYAYGGGEILLTVLVNPKDVVSVPTDYNRQKMRVCEYVVIGVASSEIQAKYISSKKIVEEMKHGLKNNPGFDFNDLSSRQIVTLTRVITGNEIQFNLKSKRSIVKKARDIFEEKGLLAA